MEAVELVMPGDAYGTLRGCLERAWVQDVTVVAEHSPAGSEAAVEPAVVPPKQAMGWWPSAATGGNCV